MDPELNSIASRSGVMRTDAVDTRTTLLLCRFRYELKTTGPQFSHEDLTEDCAMLAFSGSPQKAAWLDEAQAKALLDESVKGWEKGAPSAAAGVITLRDSLRYSGLDEKAIRELEKRLLAIENTLEE